MIARKLIDRFELDLFVFIPAFHAPHKANRRPTSAFHRFAMLALATEAEKKMIVSTLELEKGEPRYSVETIPELKTIYEGWKLFFVMGADSWSDIRTWKEWENVLLSTNHIVVSRPGYKIETGHVTGAVRDRIIDLRAAATRTLESESVHDSIYFTDVVFYNTSATELREDLSDGKLDREQDLQKEVAKYIEKYELY
jgi:nicotinate-nucleotide adenylyltransferase